MKLLKRIQLYHFVILGVILVFLTNMVISYYHAWEMYSSIGDFPGNLAHVAVVAFDTVFALATLVVSVGTLKKIDLGRRVWVAFVFGFFITTWSNIRASMGKEWHFFVTLQWKKISVIGWESLVAGLSTPAALVAIELLLSWMVTNREKFMEKLTSETGDTSKSTSNENTSNATSDTNTSYDTRNENTSYDTRNENTSGAYTSDAFTSFDTSKVFTRKDTTSYSRTSGLNTSVSLTNYGTSYVHTSNDDTSEMDTSLDNSAFTSLANTSTVGTNETNTSEESTSNENASVNTKNETTSASENTSDVNTSVATRDLNTSESNTSDLNTSNVTSETGTSEAGTNETYTSDSNTSDKDTSDSTSKVVELAKHTSKRTNKRTSRRTTWTEEDYQRVKQIALQLREQDPKNELPGRPTLKEKAGCKENLARKVLEDLKEELKQSS